MVAKVVPRQLWFTLSKNGRRTMEVEVPKIQLQALIIALTWSNMFCGERVKRGGLVGKASAHGREMLI